jgi:hypothetical protein
MWTLGTKTIGFQEGNEFLDVLGHGVLVDA